jgi:hypothetical protein
LKKCLKEVIICMMDQSRYTSHVFSENPSLAARSGNLDASTTSMNREYALDEVTLLLARSFTDAKAAAAPARELRQELTDKLVRSGALLVWVEDTQPEGRGSSQGVGCAVIEGNPLYGTAEIQDIYAIPGDNRDQILDALIGEGISASREGGYSNLRAFGADMPEGLLARHGFGKVSDARREGDPLYQLDLTSIGGESEQAGPPHNGSPEGEVGEYKG